MIRRVSGELHPESLVGKDGNYFVDPVHVAQTEESAVLTMDCTSWNTERNALERT